MSKKRQSERRSAQKKQPSIGAARAVAGISEIARRSPAHRRVLRDALARLLALSDRVVASLRQSTGRRLHQAASLAMIGTLVLFTAACDEAPVDGASGVPDDEVAVVDAQELQAEVSTGLPSDRGQSYAVKDGSLSRDDRGVYYLDWQNPTTGEYTAAQVSNLRLKLAEDGKTRLEMPASGDPILNLAGDTPIALVWPADGLTPVAEGTVTVTTTTTPTTTTTSTYYDHVYHHYPSYYGGGYHSSGWLPFAAGAVVGRATAGGVDPSATVASYRNPGVGQALVPNQPITGNVASQTAPPFSDRTISRTVSGMNRGTGAGNAVTGKTGGSVKSSSFSSGKSGAAVTSGRTGAATGKSSGGVSAPKSGGFSAGKGSSSGGAAS